MELTPLPPTTAHLHFLLGEASAPDHCAVCGRADTGLVCERCGSRMHQACYLEVAEAAELAWLRRSDDADCAVLSIGRAGWIFLCPGCRS